MRHFKYCKVIVPADRDRCEIILTDPVMIESTRRMISHYADDPGRRPPTSTEMEEFLTKFDDRISESPRLDQQQLRAVAMPNCQNSKADAVRNASEVQPEETPEPQTPTQQEPDAHEYLGWFSGVSQLLTPLKSTIFFRLRGQSAQATPTTNSHSVAGASPIEKLIPTTSDFAIPPTTPTNRLNRRKVIPQTDPKPILHYQPRKGAKTQQQVRFTSPVTVPIEMRGVLSEERKLEIWRKQDEERDEKRVKMQAWVEKEDELAAVSLAELSESGKKRKARHPDFPESFNHRGHFCVPDDSSSDEDDESQTAVDLVDDDTNSGASQQTSRPPQVGSTISQELGSYDNSPWKVVYAKRPKQKYGREPRGLNDVRDPIDQSLLPAEFIAEDRLLSQENQFQNANNSNGLASSTRNNEYNGTLFAQPPNVQANINEGKYPLAARDSTQPRRSAPGPSKSGNVFTTSTSDVQPSQQATEERRLLYLSGTSLSTAVDGMSMGELQHAFEGVPFKQRYIVYDRLPGDLKKKVDGMFLYIERPAPQKNTETGTAAGSASTELVGGNIVSTPVAPAVDGSASGLFGRYTVQASPAAATAGSASTGLFGGHRVQAPPAPAAADSSSTGLYGKSSVKAPPAPATTTAGSRSTGSSGRRNLSAPPAPAAPAASGSLFDRISAPAGDPRIGIYAAFAHPAEPSPEPTPSDGARTPTPSRTFTADYEDSDEESDSESESGSDEESDSDDEAQNTREQSSGDASILQPKTWTQTPPPKPKPSNAQLPQAPAHPTAAELAKARYEKFKPIRPSGLRNVTQMSPLQSERDSSVPIAAETAKRGGSQPKKPSNYEFDRDVVDVVMTIPEDNMIDTPLPAWVYDNLVYDFDEEVVDEVMRLLP